MSSSRKKTGKLEATGDAKPEPPKYVPPPTKEEVVKQKARARARRKRIKRMQEEARKKAEAEEAERKRLQDLADQRWRSCLQCLKDSVPQLKRNPWLMVQEPQFIHDYLDALTETLNNLNKHEDDLIKVREVLQEVYEGFVDLGRFAKTQPAFYISNAATIKRFVRLLEQVAHRGSDKALFPNVLSLLGPTFEREELYSILADEKVIVSLLSFARMEWIPTPTTLGILLNIYENISRSPRIREQFMHDAGFDRLMALTYGYIDGFTKDQQDAAQHALRLFPVPNRPQPREPTDEKAPPAKVAAPTIPALSLNPQAVATPSPAVTASPSGQQPGPMATEPAAPVSSQA